MPELPDVAVYLDALKRHLAGRALLNFRLGSPFLLRTVNPPPAAAVGRTLASVSRIGKRIVMQFVDEDQNSIWFVMHLMIAGRLRWRKPGASLPGRRGLAAFDFENGTLLFTEEGRKKRASLRVFGDANEVQAIDPGGIDVLSASASEFAEAITRENRTLKRALTDPRILSGIGNAYSDEILHAAQMSPFVRTHKLSDDDLSNLRTAVVSVLTGWTKRLREQIGDGFPEKVTAFRDEMAVHGKFGQPCPVCGSPVQRIVYAERESNYCPSCQTGGRLLADRSLSKLLKDDWPRTLDELEQLHGRRSKEGG